MPDRRRVVSLRARMVVLGTATATLILVAGGLLLGQALRAALVGQVRQATVQRAHDLAALVEQGTVPDPVEVTGDDEALVQVVDAEGGVITASANVRDRPALSLRLPDVGRTTVTQVASLPVDDDAAGFLVATTTVDGGGGPTAIHVAASLDDVTETIVAAGNTALVALPLLVLALAGVLWLLVGRTLAPVAAITAEADEISARALHRRVPEPLRADEIGRLARTLNRMLGRLDDAAQRQRRFVAAAAHELRTPITNLRAQLETAREGGDDVDWPRVSDEVLEQTVRMQHLAEQLLLLARLDREDFVPRAKAVDLDDLVDRVVTVRGREDRSIDLTPLRPVQVRGDPTLLEQAVANLVDNALRHARTVVRVGTARSDGHVAIVVEDDGPGIPHDRRAEVLRPFTRLDDARDRDAGGAGLGLAITNDVVVAHGGTVEIGDSALGGAALRIVLPAVGDPEAP
jgi:signal transduction histidine kinase